MNSVWHFPGVQIFLKVCPSLVWNFTRCLGCVMGQKQLDWGMRAWGWRWKRRCILHHVHLNFRFLRTGTERQPAPRVLYPHTKSQFLCAFLRPSCLSSHTRRHSSWMVGDGLWVMHLKENKSSCFLFLFFLKSIEFREGNMTAIPACFREGQRRKNVFRMFSRSKSDGS